ncbi:hypothetical protein ABEB36_009637 [Hypothenemus hampei]|uniref:Uncharacterized protein n=1 Tax=Hypothenemus hampei TaxID=57062 RepID=A0ABD1EJ41_HYPHA
MPVCAQTFLGILGISKHRVQNIAKKYIINGQPPKERRGGDYKTVKYGPIRESSPTTREREVPDSTSQVKKLKDVNNLLKKHFGEEWRSIESLIYYKRVLDEEPSPDMEDARCDEVDYIEENDSLRI